MDHYDNPAWHPLFVIAALGAAIIFCGIMLQLAQVVVSLAQREHARDLTGDPWGGRTLEWATSSPPPAYNFARIPVVRDRDAFWDMKQRGVDMKAAVYRPIHMPRNTGTGFVMAVFIGFAGFAMIWHIWWLAIGGFAAAMVALIRYAFDDDRDYYVEAEEVRRTEARRGHAQLRSV